MPQLVAFLAGSLRVIPVTPRRFDGVLEHVLRIDRVLRQPMGHLLLVGEAGAGKTVLSRFVSWMNGLAIFQASAVGRFSLLSRWFALTSSVDESSTMHPIVQIASRPIKQQYSTVLLFCMR